MPVLYFCNDFQYSQIILSLSKQITLKKCTYAFDSKFRVQSKLFSMFLLQILLLFSETALALDLVDMKYSEIQGFSHNVNHLEIKRGSKTTRKLFYPLYKGSFLGIA